MTVGSVAAIGERARIAGLGLAGAAIFVADTPEAVHQVWRGLPDDVDLVILTPAAAEALECGLAAPEGVGPLTAVLPS